MNRLFAKVIILLLLNAIFIVGCSQQTSLIMDHNSLIEKLREAGATVELTGDALFPIISPKQRIFSVMANRIKVNGEYVTVLEYDDEATAEAETKYVSRDGYDFVNKSANIGMHIDWVDSPHFYQKGRIIVLYIGEYQSIIDLLASIMGPPFAGMKYGRIT